MSVQAYLAEFENEAVTTRRVLERVPADRLAWRPHPKSMTLGHLALHTASTPGTICGWAAEDATQIRGETSPDPATVTEILAAHDRSVVEAKRILGGMTDDDLKKPWEAQLNGATLMSMPKAGLVRMLVLNHWYHHRGQLSVYLRLLDVPVPSIYGPSADENPFAARTA